MKSKKAIYSTTRSNLLTQHRAMLHDATTAQKSDLRIITETWPKPHPIDFRYLRKSEIAQFSLLERLEIKQLMDETVFADLEGPRRELLLSLSLHTEFTAKQAEDLIPHLPVARLLKAEVENNIFFSYNDTSRHYQMHPLATAYLLDLFEQEPLEWQQEQYQKARQWYFLNEDYVNAFDFSYISKDYEAAIECIEKGGLEPLYGKLAYVYRECYENMSSHAKQTYFKALLYLACRFYSVQEYYLQEKILDEIPTLLTKSSLPEEIQSEYFAWIDVLRSMFCVENLRLMNNLIDQALPFIPEDGEVNIHMPWTFACPSPLTIYYHTPMRLVDELDLLEEYVRKVSSLPDKKYFSLWSDVLQGEYYYMKGDVQKAQNYFQKILSSPRKFYHQKGPYITALFYLGRINVIRGRAKDIQRILETLRGAQPLTHPTLYTYMIGLAEGFLTTLDTNVEVSHSSLNFLQNTSNLSPSEPFYRLVINQFYLRRKEYTLVASLGAHYAEKALEESHILIAIYQLLLTSIAQKALGKDRECRATFKQALRLAQIDGIVMPFIEYAEHIRYQMTYFRPRLAYQEFFQQIYDAIREHSLLFTYAPRSRRDVNKGLTHREHTIIELALKGMTNREIADYLGLKEITIKKNFSDLYIKYHVTNRLALVAKLQRMYRSEDPAAWTGTPVEEE